MKSAPSGPSGETTTGALRRGLPSLGAALSLTAIFVAVLSVPLDAASNLGLTHREASAWIVALYGVAGALSLLLALRYRQPLLVTGNIFILLFIARLGTQLTWPQLVGASIVAGVVVLILGPLGLTKKLTLWLPAPIVFGLLAGAVLPFFVRMFTDFGDEPLLVGGTLLVFLLSRRLLEPVVPAILPALVAGLAIAGLTGGFGGAPIELALPALEVTTPDFTPAAILTVSPVLVVLITVQANVPSMVFLRSEGYRPPEAVISGISGLGTSLGSFLGPTGISLSLPATALCAGPDAGDPSIRHRSVYIAAGGSVLIAVLAGLATQLAEVVPSALLAAIVGLAILGILSEAMRRLTRGPLTWGPLFAFAIALSELSFLGLGSFFWAMAGGLGVSLMLEREAWSKLQEAPPVEPEPARS